MIYRLGTGMSLTFFYSVLLLFAFFNPSKHHLHLIRFPVLDSFFKIFVPVLLPFFKVVVPILSNFVSLKICVV